ncbi:outer membrane lipoprotein [Nitratireductor indicus C115]|uniref:Outer membrane lipoprotein n=1 Tax=Nitratireductor indicus C115 TaxID=1231190 RepID=K2PMS0_9HYPH|nr:membrane protein [Nitratireductor indicus]EKF42377.1 outer membrane lipoprotein [Nitratireductor indicus C115]SFQ55431.1 hypothetical protein SAMN05216176_10624 [Nitratireductor indicus]
MTAHKILIRTLGGAALVLALAGCQTEMGGGPRMARQTGVEGQWTDQQGVGISTFSSGRFTSIASDTRNKLSEGTYVNKSGNSVEISMTSLVRQTTTKVNCLLVSPDRMNCTNASGQNFVLTRSGQTS